MKTRITLLASLTIAGFAMAAVAPTFGIDTRNSHQIRLDDGGRGMDLSGLVSSKLADGVWLFYTNSGNVLLDFENDVNLLRGDALHIWGEAIGTEEVFGEVVPMIRIQGYEIK